MTGEYFATTGLNHQTRIGSFHFPGCTTVGNGTLSGTVTDGTNPIARRDDHARQPHDDDRRERATTRSRVPAGTYPSETAEQAGLQHRHGVDARSPGRRHARRRTSRSRAAAAERLLHRQHAERVPARRPGELRPDVEPGQRRARGAPTTRPRRTRRSARAASAFTTRAWAGQTFTPTVTGQAQARRRRALLLRLQRQRTRTSRSRSGRNHGVDPVPTGSDLARRRLPGFNDGAAGGLKTVDVRRARSRSRPGRATRSSSARRRPSPGTYAYTCSCVDDRLLRLEPVRERPARHLDAQRLDVGGGHDGRRA